MKRLAIFGAGGHGKVVADGAECCGWEVSFFDDNRTAGVTVGNWSVMGTFENLLANINDYDGVVVGIGNNTVRLEKSRALLAAGAKLVSVVHPSAVVSKYARIAAGTVVMAGALINVDAQIGLAGIVNTGAMVDHDCILGAGVHISPGAKLAGEVTVGDCSWVGIGASVRQQIEIGAHAMVGAGAAVVKDVPDGVTVVGCPAKAV